MSLSTYGETAVPSKTRSEENVSSATPRRAQFAARIAGPSVFSRRHASGSCSASSTRTYPAVFITAHGFSAVSAVSTDAFSAMSISLRVRRWYRIPRISQMRAKALPSVPVAPTIAIGRADPFEESRCDNSSPREQYTGGYSSRSDLFHHPGTSRTG